MRHRHLLALLTLSGFSGLAYEVLWVRLLSLSFGSTTLSFSTILAVFFGGLALGARLAGPRASKLANPVRTYAWIELAIGVTALLLYPLLTQLSGIFAIIDPGPGMAGAVIRFLVALPILLVPTLLMGATLPVVMAGVVDADEDVGEGTALIYGLNTLGACFGAYLVTFQLLPALGVWRSTLVTVAVNLLVAGLVFAMHPRKTADAKEARSAQGAKPVSGVSAIAPVPLRIASTLAFVAGLAAILLQVVWVRVFSVVLNGSAYAVGSVLIAVLFGIAVGSVLIAKRVRQTATLALWFVGLQLLSIVSLLALFAAMPRLAYELRALAGASGGIGAIHAQLGLVFAALVVPTSCAGASFPLLLAMVERRAEQGPDTLGRLYAVNTVGAILGSVLGGFLLIPMVGSESVARVALLLLAFSALAGAWWLATPARRNLALGMGLASMAGVAAYDGFALRQLAHKSDGADYAEHARQAKLRADSLVFFAETHAMNVSVRETGSARSLRLNGLGQGRFDLRPPQHAMSSTLVALVPLVHRPAAQRGLLVGLGAGVTLDVLRRLGVAEVRVIELEAAVAVAAKIVFRGQSPVEQPGVDLVVDDARQHLLLHAHDKGAGYDFITSMPAHPWVAPNIFTREFFELARANLAPGGVFCTWFGGDVYGTTLDTASAESVVRALVETFDYYAIYFVPGVNSYYLVGSQSPLTVDPGAFAELHRQPIVQQHAALAEAAFLPSHLVAAGNPKSTPPRPGPVNTDDSAYVELQAPRSTERIENLDRLFTDPPWSPEMLIGEAVGKAGFVERVLELQLTRPRQAAATLNALGSLLSETRRRGYGERIGAVAPDEATAGP